MTQAVVSPAEEIAPKPWSTLMYERVARVVHWNLVKQRSVSARPNYAALLVGSLILGVFAPLAIFADLTVNSSKHWLAGATFLICAVALVLTELRLRAAVEMQKRLSSIVRYEGELWNEILDAASDCISASGRARSDVGVSVGHATFRSESASPDQDVNDLLTAYRDLVAGGDRSRFALISALNQRAEQVRARPFLSLFL